MLWTPFKMALKKFVGVDIGTASIKVVELGIAGERIKLENYGEMAARMTLEKPYASAEKSISLLPHQEIAEAIQTIFRVAKIDTREAVFSIPDFSTFFTSFKLPLMTKEEIPEAVRFEARQHIPLPLSEVTLDWSIIEGDMSGKQKQEPKILMVAVPQEIINQYQEIARIAQVRILALEAEVFGLARALVGDKKGVVGIIDIGAQSTTISIIDGGILKVTHSFDVSSNELTRTLSKSLNISYNEAERMKRRHGVKVPELNATKVMSPLIDLILVELGKISRDFYQIEGKEIERVILCGGTALLPGLKEYFVSHLEKTVEIANPFSDIFYPPVLEETIKEIGPSYAVAVGMALRGFE